jgi:hypothetical protein
MGGAGGSGAMCSGVFSGACGTCLEAGCCSEVETCVNSGNCIDCITGVAPMCDAAGQPAAIALYQCAQANCQVECIGPAPACDAPAVSPSMGACVQLGGTIACNPVTNAGCVAGDACDTDGAGGFVCYPPPNTEALCDACGPNAAGYCQGGMACYSVTDTCARFCCNDGDCGTGVCDLTYFGAGSPVGICVQQ